ncbi:malonate transporter MadM subunit [Rhodoblastus acidophilus]|uniref:malonate transporter subunit MadM n=1 Tax=Rhodoblastus acidophilus TaxID=1074 RepID=UPI002224E9D7|nr:malonate transporter subunit MadM [Rhodoblastus acidophilus]MCW2286667.1 malonate transporter MadM subunit [Rhodoblastus acidophilus]MCW2335487.1 malonate transporter MadM subunit [Rhodoblastus acidophilus]
MLDLINKTISEGPLVTAFAFVGLVILISNFLGKHATGGRVAGSAIAVLAGLALAWVGGAITGKAKGLADIAQFSGLALMGGAMMRDFTIVATASEVRVEEAKKAGWLGFIALVLGTILPFIVGVGVAYAYGHRDAVTLTTIGTGAITYIVGPITGAAIGASSDVIALSIATGVVKAILVMIFTPVFARFMHLNNPQAAMVFGGLAGTVSGVSAGLAATDRRLVPYGALVATFHTGFGCLLGPSVLFLGAKAVFG